VRQGDEQFNAASNRAYFRASVLSMCLMHTSE
jgi:hypothetical protein